MLALAEGQARGVLLHIDRADALGAGRVRHPAVDDVAVRMAPARAPALRAVDHDAIPGDLGARRQVRQRRAGRRLRHRDRDDDLAAANPRHDARLELLVPEPVDRAHRADAGLENRKRHRRGNLAELLEHDQRLEIAEAEAAERLGDIDAEKAVAREIGDQLVRRRFAGRLDLRGDRGQPRPRVLARGRLQRALLFGQIEIQSAPLSR